MRSISKALLREQKEEQGLDDAADDIIRRAAPEIVKKIKEREVDEDVNDFYRGAVDAVEELESYMDYRYPHEDQFDAEIGHQDLYDAGYAYGKANFDKISAGMQDVVDASTRKEQIQAAIAKFEERVTEEAVIEALETVYGYAKEQMDDVHGLIKSAIKKYGWKAYAAVAFVEIMEHFVVPAVAASVFPPLAILAAVPTVEILAAVGLAVHKYNQPDAPQPEHVPGHLDWYEEQGQIADSRRRRGHRLTEAKLRKFIQGELLSRYI